MFRVFATHAYTHERHHSDNNPLHNIKEHKELTFTGHDDVLLISVKLIFNVAASANGSGVATSVHEDANELHDSHNSNGASC
jgi:hypothetical protein